MSRDLWNQRFSGQEYFYGTAPNDFLAGQEHFLKPGLRTLAVADGEGRNGVWLASRGCDVLSVDYSPVALAKAKRLAASAGVHLNTVEADLAAWDWPKASFDLVVSIFAQVFTGDSRKLFHHRLADALVPGGILLLQGYHPRQLTFRTGGPSCIDNLYTAEELAVDFSGLEILYLAEVDRHVEEGAGHVGMSALVELAARRPEA